MVLSQILGNYLPLNTTIASPVAWHQHCRISVFLTILISQIMISVVPSLVVFAIYLATHLPTSLVTALADITFQICVALGICPPSSINHKEGHLHHVI